MIEKDKIKFWLFRKAVTFGSSLALVFGLFGPSVLGFIAVCIIDAVVSIEIKSIFYINTKIHNKRIAFLKEHTKCIDCKYEKGLDYPSKVDDDGICWGFT